MLKKMNLNRNVNNTVISKLQVSKVVGLMGQAQRVQAQRVQAQRVQQAKRVQAQRVQAQRVQAQRVQSQLFLSPSIVTPKRVHHISQTEIYTTNDVLNIELFDNKKIMIYSHYSKNGKVDTYNYYMINLFSNLVDTVFILSNLPKDKWNTSKANIHVLNYDFKNDMSNLYVFIMRYQLLLNKIKSLFFINDSFLVVDKPVFEKKIEDDFFSNKHVEHFQGLIMSKNPIIHYQSYFLFIQNPIISKFIEYFKQTSYPVNQEDAINKYELGISRLFLNKHIKYFCYSSNPTAVYPYEIIQKYGLIKRQQLLSTYHITQQLSYNQIQALKNKYIHNSELVEFINSYSRR